MYFYCKLHVVADSCNKCYNYKIFILCNLSIFIMRKTMVMFKISHTKKIRQLKNLDFYFRAILMLYIFTFDFCLILPNNL